MIKNHPKVGIGVLIYNDQYLLLGQRINSHGANTWALPGGHLEFGETFAQCGMREVKEETGLVIAQPELVGVSNDIFEIDNKHYVTLFLSTHFPQDQIVQNCEPEKTLAWDWFKLSALPEKLFLPLENFLKDRGKSTIYKSLQSI